MSKTKTTNPYRAARKACGLSFAEACARTGTSPRRLYAFESGSAQPGLEEFWKLLDVQVTAFDALPDDHPLKQQAAREPRLPRSEVAGAVVILFAEVDETDDLLIRLESLVNAGEGGES